MPTTEYQISAYGSPTPGCPDVPSHIGYDSRAEAEAALDEWRQELAEAMDGAYSSESEIACRHIRIVEVATDGTEEE